MAAPTSGEQLPTEENLNTWHKRLMASPRLLAVMTEQRGLSPESLARGKIGHDGIRYTIPVRDEAGQLVNMRRYSATATASNKVLHRPGFGSPVRLFATAERGDADEALVTEGELDAIKTSSELEAAGLRAWVVSGTGGAGNPPVADELERLRGMRVFIAYDCDGTGRSGAAKLAGKLAGIAASVHVVDLGLGDGGEDLTDWFVTRGLSAEKLWELIHEAPEWMAPAAHEEPAGERRDSEELLELAVAKVVEPQGDPPSRNAVGFELACQLRDEGYSVEDAQPIMERYADAVTGAKPEPYTVDESGRSLTSAYSRPPRSPSGVPGGYSWNDAGNAERLIDRHGADMRWVPGYGGWHVWTGKHWEPDPTGRVTGWAKETARRITAEGKRLLKEDPRAGAKLLGFATTSANANKITAMLKLAQAEPGVTLAASAFDRDRNMLVCRNGTLLLGEDGATFREHRRDDYARRMAGAAYDPDAGAPRFEAFLAEAVPDTAVRRYLQKLVGYSLIGGNPDRRLIFVLGRSSTGKTTLVRLIAEVLGAYAGTFDLTLLRAKPGEGPRADIVDVISKRLIYTTEANNEWRLHADLIKRLTGSDTIKARGLFSNQFVEKEPDFTPWILTNRAPTIEHADAALWRRLVAVPLDVQRDPAREDPKLRDRLAAELPGVLAWAVEGAVAYLREGLTDPPLAVVEATMKLRESLSDLDAFLAERCEFGAEYRVPFGDLYSDYEKWCLDNRVKDAERLSGRKLADELEARGKSSQRVRSGTRGDDRKINVRLGLRLRPDDEDRSHRVSPGFGRDAP